MTKITLIGVFDGAKAAVTIEVPPLEWSAMNLEDTVTRTLPDYVAEIHIAGEHGGFLRQHIKRPIL